MGTHLYKMLEYTQSSVLFSSQKNPCPVLHELLVVSEKYRVDFVGD